MDCAGVPDVGERLAWPAASERASSGTDRRALPHAAQGREDGKDEPGAADFYYGEMEMRRHARRGRTSGASRGQVERAILTAYWLMSGYGLRAWRALAWLLVVILVATVGLWAVGFTAEPVNLGETGQVGYC
jgi:hypothetical protein